MVIKFEFTIGYTCHRLSSSFLQLQLWNLSLLKKKKQQQQQRSKITELFLGRESHFKTKTTS